MKTYIFMKRKNTIPWYFSHLLPWLIRLKFKNIFSSGSMVSVNTTWKAVCSMLQYRLFFSRTWIIYSSCFQYFTVKAMYTFEILMYQA